VSILHARNAIPHQVYARHRLRKARPVGRRSTDAFQTHAAPSRSGQWAASMRYATVHRTTRVDSARRRRSTSRLFEFQKRTRFVVNDDSGYASAGVRRRPTLCRGRCCKRNRSRGPCLCCRGHSSKNARVSRVSREPRRVGQRLSQQAHYVYVTESRPHLLLQRVSACPNSPADDGRTVLKVRRSRREQHVSGFGALCDCTLHRGCRWDDTITCGVEVAHMQECD
jgi:hypothetical protein